MKAKARSAIGLLGPFAGAAVVLGGIMFVMRADKQQTRAAESQTPVARVAVSNTEFDFGRVKPGVELSHHFTVGNGGTRRLVLNVEDCGCGDGITSHVILMPGDQTQIPISMTAESHSEHQQRSLAITTSDPANPRIEFQIHASVAR